MRALICKAWGPVEDLVIEEWDDPVPDDEEVVIDVKAAGINFPDILIIAGKYQDKIPPPFVPGNEASGILSSHHEVVRSPRNAKSTRTLLCLYPKSLVSNRRPVLQSRTARVITH
jgi:NADPH:quinone reductase-like Zn-dependent oxidoreductase